MQDIYRMMEERSSREFAPEGEFDKDVYKRQEPERAEKKKEFER